MASHSQSGKFTCWLLFRFSRLRDCSVHAQPLLSSPSPSTEEVKPAKVTSEARRLISYLEWLLPLSPVPTCSPRFRPDGWGVGKEGQSVSHHYSPVFHVLGTTGLWETFLLSARLPHPHPHHPKNPSLPPSQWQAAHCLEELTLSLKCSHISWIASPSELTELILN